jgi:hypothetical protein
MNLRARSLGRAGYLLSGRFAARMGGLHCLTCFGLIDILQANRLVFRSKAVCYIRSPGRYHTPCFTKNLIVPGSRPLRPLPSFPDRGPARWFSGRLRGQADQKVSRWAPVVGPAPRSLFILTPIHCRERNLNLLCISSDSEKACWVCSNSSDCFVTEEFPMRSKRSTRGSQGARLEVDHDGLFFRNRDYDRKHQVFSPCQA